MQINYDRIRLGQMGLTVDQAGRSVAEGLLPQPLYATRLLVG